jgi:hypothetical protein
MPGVASVTESVVGAVDSVTVGPVDMPESASVPRLLRSWFMPTATAPTVTTALAPIAAINRICLSFKSFSPLAYSNIHHTERRAILLCTNDLQKILAGGVEAAECGFLARRTLRMLHL